MTVKSGNNTLEKRPSVKLLD